MSRCARRVSGRLSAVGSLDLHAGKEHPLLIKRATTMLQMHSLFVTCTLSPKHSTPLPPSKLQRCYVCIHSLTEGHSRGLSVHRQPRRRPHRKCRKAYPWDVWLVAWMRLPKGRAGAGAGQGQGQGRSRGRAGATATGRPQPRCRKSYPWDVWLVAGSARVPLGDI